MQTAINTTPLMTTDTIAFSKRSEWTGRAVSTLPVLFLLIDGVMKLFKPEVVVNATLELGYAESVIVPLGLVLVGSTILYIIPRTAVLGAVLLTGYLGGAVATHVRMLDEAFPIVFPIIIGSLLWLGLYLRDARVRSLLHLRS